MYNIIRAIYCVIYTVCIHNTHIHRQKAIYRVIYIARNVSIVEAIKVIHKDRAEGVAGSLTC